LAVLTVRKMAGDMWEFQELPIPRKIQLKT